MGRGAAGRGKQGRAAVLRRGAFFSGLLLREAARWERSAFIVLAVVPSPLSGGFGRDPAFI